MRGCGRCSAPTSGTGTCTDIAGVVAEAHELVEKGFLTDEQWRQVVFDNPVEMLTRVNPDFFAGTAVADRVPIRQPASP